VKGAGNTQYLCNQVNNSKWFYQASCISKAFDLKELLV